MPQHCDPFHRSEFPMISPITGRLRINIKSEVKAKIVYLRNERRIKTDDDITIVPEGTLAPFYSLGDVHESFRPSWNVGILGFRHDSPIIGKLNSNTRRSGGL